MKFSLLIVAVVVAMLAFVTTVEAQDAPDKCAVQACEKSCDSQCRTPLRTAAAAVVRVALVPVRVVQNCRSRAQHRRACRRARRCQACH